MEIALTPKVGEVFFVLETYPAEENFFVEAYRFLAHVQVPDLPTAALVPTLSLPQNNITLLQMNDYIIAAPVSWSAEPMGLMAELGTQADLTAQGEPTDLMVLPVQFCYPTYLAADQAGRDWLEQFHALAEEVKTAEDEPDE